MSKASRARSVLLGALLLCVAYALAQQGQQAQQPQPRTIEFEPITEEMLRQVEEAEKAVADLGIEVLRVRHHGSVARIEVLPLDMPKLLSSREILVSRLRELGFTYVDLDLQGYRAGSMGEVLGRQS